MSKRLAAKVGGILRFPRSRLALAITAHMLVSGNALGSPVGGEIVGGSGAIEQEGAATTIIQNTDNLAIDWQSFDIGKDERVAFVQPGQSAVALNRILSNKGSEILGRIDANGHVILVNPRGVVFGEGAVINVGGLIASGLQINPEDFMNGDLVFKRIEGTDGIVINSGMISAAAGGNVALLGVQVENRGLISANLGSVILASGKEAVLTFDESGLLGVRVDEALLQDELGSSAAVANSGEIRSENGRILLSATTTRDVFSRAVNWGDQKQARSVTYNEDGSFILGAGGNVENSGALNVSGEHSAGIVVAVAENVTHTGSIYANALHGWGGNVELHSNTTTVVAEEGVVTAAGANGGDIKLLGKNVGLFDQASVEAIGVSGGGTVFVGGDREGLNTRVRNADFVYVGEGASIDVSATYSGDGGSAILFAEDTARIYGGLVARGGENGGGGGFVETSGKRGFEITKSPDLAATNGVAGHWLIDPYSISIEAERSERISTQNPFVSNGNSAVLSVTTLESALNATGGATVTVQTGSGGDTQQGNITVSSEINLTSNVTSTLNLIAHNNITINADITTLVGGEKAAGRTLNVHLLANTGSRQGSVRFGVDESNRVVNSDVRIETGGGNFVIGNVDADGILDTAVAGAYNVDFSRVSIDVTSPPYGTPNQPGLINTHFAGRGVATNDYQYLRNSGRILVNAGNNVILGGTNGERFANGNNEPQTSDNGSVTMLVRGREKDRVNTNDSLEKIHIIAGNDIELSADRVWTYDNNPTENSGSGQSPYNGFTTLKLEAGGIIDLKGKITYAWNQRNSDRLEQNDRLMIDLAAKGNISVGEIATAGGDFIVDNAASFSASTIDTSSPYGAGNISIEATGDITLPSLSMFVSNASGGTLRNPSLTAIAGGALTISSDIYTRGTDLTGTENDIPGGDIHLGASTWNIAGRSLVTRDGGNITLTTSGDLDLPVLNSSGNITLNHIGEDEVTEGSEFEITGLEGDVTLDGVLTLALGAGGSVNIANITNNSTANAANLVITSARDVQLGINGAITLGNSAVSGNLVLTSDAGIAQEAETKLVVEGTSTFNVDNGSVILNQLENNFVEAVSVVGTNVQDVDLSSIGNLIFGGVDAGTLSATSGGNITQEEILSVTGAAHLSAGGDITLAASNQFTTLSIAQAGTAKITNQQALELASVQNVATLYLTISEGELTQSTALELDNLILDVKGNVDLTQPDNTIGNLSGAVASGEIVATGPEQLRLQLGELSISEDDVFVIRAREIDLNSTIQLQNNARLTFENVADFILRGALQGEDAATNAIAVNGTTGDGIYTVTNTATWEDVSLALNGGEGSDTLHGPNLDATWNIQSAESAEPHTLTAQGELFFQSMEILQGGTGDDSFAFAAGAPTTLSLNGGEGEDTADYSGIMSSIRVPLGSSAGLSGIENIVGNGISALVAQGDTANIWMLSGADAGTVTPSGSTGMTFKGFNELVGGAGADEFIVAADLVVSSQLDGGGGLNTLQGLDTDQLWIVSGNKDIPLVTLAQPAEGDEPNRILVTDAKGITGMWGGEGRDTFQYLIADSRVGADGGGGTGVNTAEFLIDADYTVSLGALNDRGISNVAKVVGNAAAGFVSTLEIVGDSDNVWTFNAEASHKVKRGEEEIEFENFNRFLGGAGADRFNLSASPAGSINGRGGNDSFYLLAPEITADLVGGDGDDTLRAYQQGANLWSIDASEATLSSAVENSPNKVTFTGMEALAGAENFADAFSFQTLPSDQLKISAGNGAAVDTIDYSSVEEALPVTLGGAGLTGFERVIGNGALSTLTGAPAPSTWTLSLERGAGQVQWTQNNVVQTTAFSGFGHWIGGSANDSFTLLTLDGAPASIRGGGGVDELDLSALTAGVDVGVGLDAGRPLNILEIETLSANAAFTNSLTSSADQSGWLIDSRNGGALASGAEASLVFLGFQQLHGLHANLFDVQASGVLAVEDGAGSLRGGDGNSVLKVSGDVAHTWTLNGAGAGSLARAKSAVTTFAGLTALEGAGGRDDFVLANPMASISRLDGGGGTNSLSASWTSETALEWAVTDGQGSLTNHIGRFQRIHELTGQTGADQFLIDGNTTLNFIASGAGDDAVTLADNASLTRLSTGDGSDTIKVSGSASVTDPIDGGAHPEGGSDHLDLTGYGSAMVWNIADNLIGNFRYTNLERISAPAGLNNLLQGPDSTNTWTITGTNSGRLQSGSGTLFDFAGISQLLGGSQADTFVLAGGAVTGIGEVAGGINGGGGNNSLQGNNAANQWTVTGPNTGFLKSPAGDVDLFENIQNLLGGTGEDNFSVSAAGRLTGWFAGGAGADWIRFNSEQPLSVWLADTSGKNPTGDEWRRVRTDVESVIALAESPSHLRLESTTAQEWTVSAADKGTIAGVTFEGFGQLTGGNGNDTFRFLEQGSLSGSLNGGDGDNAVNLQAATRAMTVALARGAGADVDLQITNVHRLDANTALAAQNRLWAPDETNKWDVQTRDAGDLNDLTFTGFGNLTGGSADDQFLFQLTGELSGQLDGGDHTTGDSLDYSSVTRDLPITLGGDQPLLRNIEQLVGNDRAVLVGPDVATSWVLQEGTNRGQVSFGVAETAQQFSFSRISGIQGGAGVDTFDFQGGALSGLVNGGGGNDLFRYWLQPNAPARRTELDGGSGEDVLEVLEGGADFSGTYSLVSRPEAQPQGLFEFAKVSSPAAAGPGVGYSAVETVLMKAELSAVRLQGSAAADNFQLGDMSWQLNDHARVHYLENGLRDLRLTADALDAIQLTGTVDLPGELRIDGGTVTAESDALIRSASLNLQNSQEVATEAAPLRLDISHLTLAGSVGPVYLHELNNLNLADVGSTGAVSITVENGDLTQSGPAITTGAWNLTALNGKLLLDQATNRFGGPLMLEASEVTLHNGSDTHLAGVQARNLMVGSSGAITSDGPLVVTDITRLISTGDLVLTHADNRLNQVFLTTDGAASLVNSGVLTLVETDVAGHLDLNADRLSIVGEVSAASMTGKFGTGGLEISNSLQTSGDVSVDTTGAIYMKELGQIVSTGGDIALISGQTQALGLLSAEEGEVRLDSAAAIVDVNDFNIDPINIKAERLFARAVSGIGSFNPLETEVTYLDVMNISEAVWLSNTGHLTVEKLRNRGDITLNNSTDVLFHQHSVNGFFGTDPLTGGEEPRYPDPKQAADIPVELRSHFQLQMDKGGRILTDGSVVLTEPHISAYNVTILNHHGSFSFPPPVIYAPGTLTIRSRISLESPYRGFGVEPAVLSDDTPYYNDVVGAGEQLIEVETLSDIDPAVFTQVNNYIYQEVSIRLPSDQLYEDE